MHYIITFDISGIILVLLVLIVHNFFYPAKTKINNLYTFFGICTILVMIFDILSSKSLDYIQYVPDWVNYLLFDAYYIFAVTTAYAGKHYIFARINWRTKVGLIIDRSIAYIYGFILFHNHFKGWLFSINDHVYQRGPIFHLSYIVCFIYILHVAIIIIKYKSHYERKIYALNLSFIGFNYLGAFIQIMFPYLLVTFFGTAISFLIMLFSLETPEYHQMQKTLEELEKSKITEEKAKKEAIQANKAKSIFLAEMSHEIRTPINTIMGLNEMILRDSSEQQIVEYASKIKGANNTLLETINDILDLSKIESGKITLDIAEYDLSELIISLVDMIKVRAEKKNLEFKLTVNEKLPAGLIGDYARIKQIVINLLTNAVKYTKEGFVELVFDGFLRNNKYILHIEVKDSGIGIKKENIEKALSAFERIESTENKGIEGTGLGLNIVQQLLGLMGSKLKVESVYSKGSTFSFEILQKICDKTPIGNIEDKVNTQKKEYFYQASFIAPNAKILVVDDTEINLYVIQQLLKETQIQIVVATSGIEALKLVRESYFDLIFLDHMMPEMDGIETLNRIKSDDNLCKNVPIVALTANAISGSEDMYLSKGFSGYISKPINQEKIENIISSMIPEELIQEAPVRKRRISSTELNLPEIEGMDTAYAMTHFYSKEMFMDVLKNFYITLPQNINYIDQLSNDLDKDGTEISSTIKSFQIAVHTMKSSSALVGMAQLSGIAKLCESAAKEENITNIKLLTPFLLTEMRNMNERLSFLFEEETTEETDFSEGSNDTEKVEEKIDNNMLRAYLHLLGVAFNQTDIDKLDEIIGILGKFSYQDDIQNHINSLKIDVSNLDAQNGVKHISLINDILKVDN